MLESIMHSIRKEFENYNVSLVMAEKVDVQDSTN